MPMKRFFRVLAVFAFLFSLLFPTFSMPVFAQSLDDFFNFGNYPVNYDQQPVIGRSTKSPDSIDNCLERKEYFYNEIHNIWVEGLERCKFNSKGILARATFEGISTDPADEQLCVNKREDAILVHGVPSEDEARRWSERCSYLGTVGGAGPVSTINSSSSSSSRNSTFFSTPSSGVNRNTSSNGLNTGSLNSFATNSATREQAIESLNSNAAFRDLNLSDPAQVQVRESMIMAELARRNTSAGSTAGATTTSTNFTPVYTGTGVQVPDESLVPGGVSKEKSLIQLIVFYTNSTLPYVSVISVFVFVAAGLYYILSFTNEELNAKAKSMMMYVVIGIVIIISAYTIVNTLVRITQFQG